MNREILDILSASLDDDDRARLADTIAQELGDGPQPAAGSDEPGDEDHPGGGDRSAPR